MRFSHKTVWAISNYATNDELEDDHSRQSRDGALPFRLQSGQTHILCAESEITISIQRHHPLELSTQAAIPQLCDSASPAEIQIYVNFRFAQRSVTYSKE